MSGTGKGRKPSSTEGPELSAIEFRFENYMKIKTARLVLQSSGAWKVGGNNEEGKTALFEAIAACFAGKKAMPPVPVRRGAEKADLFADLGEFTITRVVTAEGGHTVKVADKVGRVYPHPQAFLDAFFNSLSFDPHAFARMDSRKQAETLRQLIGLDLTPFDDRLTTLEQERTIVGREADKLAGQVAGAPCHKEVPSEPLDVSALMDELDKVQKANRAVDVAIQRAKLDLEANSDEQGRVDGRIGSLQAQISALQAQLGQAQAQQESLQAAAPDLRSALTKAKGRAKKDEEPIRAQLRDAGDINNRIAANTRRDQLVNAAAEATDRYLDLTTKIQAERDAKEQALADSKFPIKDLTFDEAGVYYRGLPFSQASKGESIRLATQLFFAMKPKFPLLLIRDAALLDENNLAIVTAEAAAHHAPVLLEMVGTHGAAIIVKDGVVDFDAFEVEK